MKVLGRQSQRAPLASTSWGVFLRRLCGLGRDESGVALVVTLAFVIPLFIMVTLTAGVGDAVRRKIRLQNAVDMAARSAAVVQADLLSKMAVVNRVTGWTYVNYCRRRMDWIMGRFCKKCIEEWEKKDGECRTSSMTRGLPVPYPPNSSSGVGTAVPSLSTLDVAMTAVFLPKFKKFLGKGGLMLKTEVDIKSGLAEVTDASLATLKREIGKDHDILTGTDVTWKRLRNDYKKEIKKAAEDIFKANFLEKDGQTWGRTTCVIDFNNTDLDKIFKKVGSGEQDEKNLFEMAGLDSASLPAIGGGSPYYGKNVLGIGADSWFVIDHSADHPKRVYRENNEFLQAKFEWAWYAWGMVPGDPPVIKPPMIKKGDYDSGTVTVKASEIIEVATTQNGIIYRDVPVTAYRLKEDFWTQSGAITVAGAWELPNPFAFMAPGSAFFADVDAEDDSLWSALNGRIAGSSRPRSVMAIASARAAYKRAKRGESRRQRIKKTRYCLSHTGDTGDLCWNLCETDWDGVLIPTVAAGSKWSGEGAAVRATTTPLAELFARWPEAGGKTQCRRVTSPRLGDEPAGGETSKLLDWVQAGKLLIH